MQTSHESNVSEVVAFEVAEAINQDSGFRAKLESISGSLARIDVDGPLQVRGVPFGCCWLTILIGEECISLSLMLYASHPEAFSPSPVLLDSLDRCLTDAVKVCFELSNPECFDQLAESLAELGIDSLPVIGETYVGCM